MTHISNKLINNIWHQMYKHVGFTLKKIACYRIHDRSLIFISQTHLSKSTQYVHRVGLLIYGSLILFTIDTSGILLIWSPSPKASGMKPLNLHKGCFIHEERPFSSPCNDSFLDITNMALEI